MAKRSKAEQVMVLTGASSGIGRATALAWAGQGGSLVLAARSPEPLQEVAEACRRRGGKALPVPTDVTKEEQVHALAAAATAHFGKIDVWVNNAAVSVFGDFLEIPTADIRQLIETNLFGYIHGARAAVKQFRMQDRGTLINVSSVTGVVGQAFSTPYSITKFGIRGLSDSLGQELENKKHIHVCTVLPSVIDTPIYTHAANYSGHAINPPVAAAPAEKVANTILKLTVKPEKETFVGKSTFIMRLSRFVSPALFDTLMRKIINSYEFKEETVLPTSGNLYTPMPQQAAVSGGWLKKEREGRRKTLRKTATKAAVTGALLFGAGWLLTKKG